MARVVTVPIHGKKLQQNPIERVLGMNDLELGIRAVLANRSSGRC